MTVSKIKTEDVLEEVYAGITKFQSRLAKRQTQWERNLKSYHGGYDIDDSGGRRVVTNLVFGFVSRIIPAIYYKNPYVAVQPKGATQRQYALLLEELVNYLINSMKFDMEMRRVIFDSLFKGIGIGKVGMVPLKKDKKGKGKTTSGGVSQDKLLQALAMSQPKAIEEEMLPARGSKEDLEFQIATDFDQNAVQNRPFFTRIPPNFIAVDRYATSISSARWVAQRILKPMDELEKESKFNQSFLKGVEPTFSEDAFEEMYGAWNADGNMPISRENEDRNRGDLIELWEVWHKPTRKVYTFCWHSATQGDFKAIEEKDWPYDFDEFPFQDLRFNADPDQWFGIPDVSTWDNLVTAYNFVQSIQTRHLLRFNRKYVIPLGANTEGVKEALQSGQDGAVVVVPNEFAGSIVPIMDAPLSPDVYALKQQLRNDLTFVSGVTEQRQGSMGKSGTTATEASLVEGMAQLRDNDRMYLVAKFCEIVSRQILQLSRQSLSLGDVAFATNDENLAQMWEQVLPELNAAEVDVQVTVGSTAFRTKEVRNKQLLDFMNVASQLVDPKTRMPLLNQRVLALRIAEAMDIDNPKELLMPDMAPMAGYVPQSGSGGGEGQGPVPGGVGNPGIEYSQVQNVQGRSMPSGAPNPTQK